MNKKERSWLVARFRIKYLGQRCNLGSYHGNRQCRLQAIMVVVSRKLSFTVFVSFVCISS